MPAFTSSVSRVAAQYGLVMADLGARAGLCEDLLPLASAVTAIGFEPDPEEARRHT
jgi:hypothetical protein